MVKSLSDSLVPKMEGCKIKLENTPKINNFIKSRSYVLPL